MNAHLTLITFIVLLLAFFSTHLDTSSLTGTAIGELKGDEYSYPVYFRAWRTMLSQGHTGSGVVSVELPREPVSCTLEGKWVTDNHMLKPIGHKNQGCHKAQGTFFASVDKSGQIVENDASLFRWAGPTETATDPWPEQDDGYMVSVKMCDHLYNAGKKRNYVRAWVENFGSTTFTMKWEYLDKQYVPAVDVWADLKCTLKSVKKPSTQKIVLPSVPGVSEDDEMFPSEAVTLTSQEIAGKGSLVHDVGKVSFGQRVKQWFFSLFS